MYAVTRSLREQRRPAPRSRRTPGRATASSSKRFVIDRECVLLYQSMADHPPRGPQGRSLAARRRRRVARRRRVRLPRTSATQLEVTRSDVPVAGLPPALAGLRIGLHHRRPPQPLGLARRRRARGRAADGRAARSHRPRRRLRHLGRPRLRRSRPPRRSRRCRRRTACSASSAITTTTTTCRRRWPRSGVQMLKDARTRSDDQERDASISSASASGPSARRDIAALIARRGTDDDPARARSATPHRGRGARTSRSCCPATRTAARSCCRCVGAVAAQKFPVVAGIGRRDRTTMFVSRGVGTVYVPVRINCPPEVAVLTLQPA